jgi:hypothetical protein
MLTIGFSVMCCAVSFLCVVLAVKLLVEMRRK